MWRLDQGRLLNSAAWTIPAGSMVLLKYFSSNHDDSMFDDADGAST